MAGSSWTNQVQNQVIVGGGGSAGVFVYDPVVAAGDLIASITNSITGPFGEATQKGVTSYGASGVYVKLYAGQILFQNAFGQDAIIQTGDTNVLSVVSAAGWAFTQPVQAIASAANQLVFIEQTGTAGHALTAFLNADGGTSQSAINAVSANSAFTAVEITGNEKNRGTLKITHKGWTAGADSGAAAISIDLQTANGGTTGTAAGGIVITSTTDTTYATSVNMFNVKIDNSETVIKTTSDGVKMGISVPVSHVPSAMLEIDLVGTEIHHLDLRDGAGTHCYLYTSAGALVYRGGTGTITTLAPA